MNVILFDGICNLCNGAVTFVVKRDRKGLFRFVSLQSETGKSLLKRYAVESTNKTLYYFRNNRCYSKSTAILYILKDLGGFWQCLYPLILIPAKLRDAIYLLVSKYRYRIFGKADSCMVFLRKNLKDQINFNLSKKNISLWQRCTFLNKEIWIK